MAKEEITVGETSHIADIFIQDVTSSTGAGLAGLVFNSAGLTCYWKRRGDATWTALSLVTATLGTWASGGFKEGDATNAKGMYELGLPNAALLTGAKSVIFYLQGAANMAPCIYEYTLKVTNDQDGVRGGLTALPNAAAAAAGGLPTVGTGTGQLNPTSGAMPVSDKTGFSLTQSFPANFASLAITGGGAVTAGTVSDKTGYSLSQAFPTNFAAQNIDSSGRALLQPTQTGVTIPTVTSVGSVSGAVGSVSGAVGSVTGNVGGNVTGSVGSVAGAVGSVTGNVGGSVASVSGGVTVTTNNDKSGYSLTTAPPTANAIVTAILAAVADGTVTVADVLMGLAAITTGPATGLDGNTQVFKSPDGTKDRITAVFSSGARTITNDFS